MRGARLTLLVGLSFALAHRVFADSTPKFAYVSNYCGSSTDCLVGNVSAYAINRSTGALRPIAGSPFAAGSEPVSVTVDPSERFAYVANSGDDTVSAFAINSATGALREVSGSPFAAGDVPSWVTVDPSGRFVYVANQCNFSRNCSRGEVSAYTVNRSTGALRAIAGSPFAAGHLPFSVTVEPSGRFAYVANNCISARDCSTGNVSAFTINSATGALRAVSGSPFGAGLFPYSVAVEPSGRFAYVANDGDDTVSAFAINSATGALREVSGSPFAAGIGPDSVAVDPWGRFAYVANAVGNSVSAYAISSTGALREVAGSPFASKRFPYAVTVDPSGRFTYVANFEFGIGAVSAYAIKSSTGGLRAVAGSPYATGVSPQSVAIAGGPDTSSFLTLAPRLIAFGHVPSNASSVAQSVTVTNTSPKAVTITSIVLRGKAPGQYAFTDDCGPSLAAFARCTLKATFRPTTPGEKTAFLDVNGGGGGLRSVRLTGTGT